MITVRHFPKNPDGCELVGFPFALLNKEDHCIQGIRPGEPRGNESRPEVDLTAIAARMRDDLLSLPGVSHLSYYQNWMEHRKAVTIIWSGALTWDELQLSIEKYVEIIAKPEPQTQVLTGIIEEAKKLLDAPVILVERFSASPRLFAIHTRRPLTSYVIQSSRYPEMLDRTPHPLFKLIHDELGNVDVWVTPYEVTVHLHEDATAEERDVAIPRVLSIVGKQLYPDNPVTARERETSQDPDDSWSDSLSDDLDGEWS